MQMVELNLNMLIDRNLQLIKTLDRKKIHLYLVSIKIFHLFINICV